MFALPLHLCGTADAVQEALKKTDSALAQQHAELAALAARVQAIEEKAK